MIYLDNNSTTAPELSALSYAKEVVSKFYGNPSSSHSFGRQIAMHIDDSREYLEKLLGAEKDSIIFTSGGTEANNIAIFSELNNCDFITPVTEHSSVVQLAKPENLVKVTSSGFINWNHLEDRLKKSNKSIVALSYANNETGVILFDEERLLSLKNKYNFHLHVDAVQAFGKVALKVSDLIDTMSLSGHKFHAVKGIGALYVKPKLNLPKLWAGGAQEFGVRPGTENTFGIVNLGIISKLASIEGPPNFKEMHDFFLDSLSDIAMLNGDFDKKVSNTLNLYFPKINDNILFSEVLNEEGIICSVGSACSSGIQSESRVLRAMFPNSDSRVFGSIRFSMSKNTTESELKIASEIIRGAIEGMGQ